MSRGSASRCGSGRRPRSRTTAAGAVGSAPGRPGVYPTPVPGSPLGRVAAPAGDGGPPRPLSPLWPQAGTPPVPGRAGPPHPAVRGRGAPGLRGGAGAADRGEVGPPRGDGASDRQAEIYLGKHDKFLTVVSHLETREPLWAGKDRKRETLDRFFAEALPPRRRSVKAVCVDTWKPFAHSLRAHLPHARLIYDKFHGSSMPMRPWMRPGGRTSSGRAAGSGAWCAASAGSP
jgi:Transposase